MVCRTRTSWWMLWSMPLTCSESWGPPCFLQRATMSCVSFTFSAYLYSSRPVYRLNFVLIWHTLHLVRARSSWFAGPLCVIHGERESVPNSLSRHGHLRWTPLPGSVSYWWVRQGPQGGRSLRAGSVRGKHHPQIVSVARMVDPRFLKLCFNMKAPMWNTCSLYRKAIKQLCNPSFSFRLSADICSSPWVWCMSAPSPSLARTFWRTWWRCVEVFSTHSEGSSSETTYCSAPATSCLMTESRQSKLVRRCIFVILGLRVHLRQQNFTRAITLLYVSVFTSVSGFAWYYFSLLKSTADSTPFPIKDFRGINLLS